LKILYLVHQFPPQHTGGTENYTYGIASAFREANHSVNILCGEDIQLEGSYKNTIKIVDEVYKGLPVRKLSFNFRLARDPYFALYLDNPRIVDAVINYASIIRPDIIHITSCVYLSAGILKVGRHLGIPTLLTLTDYWFVCPRVTLLTSTMELCDGQQEGLTCARCMFGETRTVSALEKINLRWPRAVVTKVLSVYSRRIANSSNFIYAVNRRNSILPKLLNEAKWVISPSRFMCDWFLRHKVINESLLHYQPHGHLTQQAASGARKTPSNLLRFGYIGQIGIHKGIHILIKAFRELKSKLKASLNIYGKIDVVSDYGKELFALAGNDPQIFFHGPFDNQDVGRVLSNIDVMVIPSLWYENAPVTIAEAFAARTPVIATNLGGMAEAIHDGIDGYLFERGDINDLVGRMAIFIETPEIVTKMSNAIRKVKSVDEEIQELIIIYEKIVGTSTLYAP
jgi:glycosyltransferase involved in cell wall biosynthesis